MIKTIVFDYGNVLIQDRSKDPTIERLLNTLPKARQNTYRKALVASEAGKISYSEMFKIVQAVIFPRKSLQWVRHYYMFTRVLPPWWLAKQLKKNYPVLIFSNNHKGWPKKVFKYFHLDEKDIPFVNSAIVGLRKPNPKFYKYLVDKYELVPEETVFIDDRKENLAPARKLKFKTFYYQNNTAELKQWLKRYGVKVS